MFKQLKIANFRGFNKEVTMNFAPITVLIGHNNAGKSSIIKFLLMLQQSLSRSNKGFLISRGDKVDLGRFYSLKNTKSRKRNLYFSLSVQGERSPRDALWYHLRDLGEQPYPQESLYATEATVSYNKGNFFQGKTHAISFSSEEKKLLERTDNINEDSVFLDFSDVQQREFTEPRDINLRKMMAENACIETLESHIKGLCHIGPDKAPLPRTFDTGGSKPDTYVGQEGEYTIQHLWELHTNRWRKEFVNRYVAEALRVTDISFMGRGELAQGFAINQTTGAKTNLGDFGFGLSQCLPVFVQGAIMPRGSTLICEQPEAQVHPTAQLELGQFFADLWKQRGVASIIETHSDSILLRLRRLISNGDLDASDVSVTYFDVDDKQAVTVRKLRIEEDGSMKPGLPIEFFHANIKEAGKMRAGE